MTLRCLAAIELIRDSLGAEISANAGQVKKAYAVSTGCAGISVPTGYGTSIIPSG